MVERRAGGRVARLKLVIEYVGSEFSGWQYQPGQTTVQGEIESVLSKLYNQPIRVLGAGRTDAGVHALGQVAHFDCDAGFPLEKLQPALNYHLPRSIRIHSVASVPTSWHARFSATSRRYRYLLATCHSALWVPFRWERPGDLSPERLRQSTELIRGEHDFSAFCVAASRQENNRCRIDYARWFRYGPLWSFEIRGNRFLHSMVRSLVGGMVNLAAEDRDDNPRNLTMATFTDMLREPDDHRNPFTAPPQGLYLVSVGYPTTT